jgi:hypothetical protein
VVASVELVEAAVDVGRVRELVARMELVEATVDLVLVRESDPAPPRSPRRPWCRWPKSRSVCWIAAAHAAAAELRAPAPLAVD